jgi:hypothetical protein
VDPRRIRLNPAGDVDADGQRITRAPCGITIGPDGALYSAGRDNVVRHDMTTGKFDRIVAASPGMNVQSLIFIPKMASLCGA